MAVNESQVKEGWAFPKDTPDLPPDQLEEWKRLTLLVRETAIRLKITKSETARRIPMALGTFSQWYDGTYKGTIENQNAKIKSWLQSVDELTAAASRIPLAPSYVETPTSRELTETLLYAQMMPEMVMVTLGAGMGKTITANTYCATRPHTYLVTMRPLTASVHGMLLEFCQALGLNERSPAKLDRAIGDKLRRNGRNTLLIVDESQNLKDDAVNQLRYFLDVYGTGIALLGNEELYVRFGGEKPTPAYAQIHRRIGKRLRRLQPQPGDVEAMIDAWGVEDEAVHKLLRIFGKRPGALSQITKTMQLAGVYAAGEGSPITAQWVKRAWENRTGEVL